MSDLSVTKRFVIAQSELQWTAARSGGPGGQNVNKVNSKVTLKWKPTTRPGFDGPWRRRFIAQNRNRINRDGEIVVQSERTRDQSRNLADAKARLVQWLLACRYPPKKRVATRPTAGSRRRRLENKRQKSEKKRLRRRPSMED